MVSGSTLECNRSASDAAAAVAAVSAEKSLDGVSGASALNEQRKVDANMIEQKFAELQAALGGQIRSAISQALIDSKAADFATVQQLVIEASCSAPGFFDFDN